MGTLLSTRQRNGVEEVDVITNHAYKYPPRSGNYFASHFIMGGERFDTPQPESYLFGENSDLNFLGSRPTPFPYPPPQPNEPTKTLKCLVNIRKESLRFVRASNEYSKITTGEGDLTQLELGTNSSFNIEFTFDCDVKCAITVHYFCTEEITPTGVTYVPRDPTVSSKTFHFNKGANQQFCQPTHVFNPAKYGDDELQYDVDREVIPIAIYCVAEEGPEDMRQSHTTIAAVEKIADGIYLLKALKQKLWVDGLCYLLQEIYGIENKNNEKAGGDEDTEDNGSECVICMCDVRDTLILPCRHLCLCNSCADSLRYQANNCPICRAPFRALLQIRALQKCSTPSLAPISQPDANCDNIPPGYEAVSLIEALNGPCQPRQPPSAVPDLVESPDNENAVLAARILSRHSPSSKSRSQPTTPEYTSKSVVTVLTSRSEDEGERKETQKCPLLKDEMEVVVRGRQRQRDSIKMVNEKEKDENVDEDSEAEKLSPLLQKERPSLTRSATLALHMDDVLDHIDDHEEDIDRSSDTKPSVKDKNGRCERGDESDYYTPDEPSAPTPNNLYDSQTIMDVSSSVDSTPSKLPGTPLSVKSSGDSYTSGGSTKQLLTLNKNSSSGDGDSSVHI